MNPKPITPEAFALALFMHRSRIGITQAQAATLCSVSARTWGKWEQAQRAHPMMVRGVLATLGER